MATLREEFLLSAGEIYLDGNSLGPVTLGARRRVGEILDREWGEGLIRSWNEAGWMDAPLALGDRLAPADRCSSTAKCWWPTRSRFCLPR